MKKKYNLYGIGNALVDMEFEVHDEFFTKHKIDKGLMTLVDEERQNYLLSALGDVPLKQQCGGSAANTVIANSQFGGRGFYSCKVAHDPIGNFYFQDLQDNKVDSNLQNSKREHGITGKCLVLVTPDAERTMNTFLGITSTMSKFEVDAVAIADSEYLYMEGYLVASPTGKEAAILAREIAEKNGVKTAITFSDVNMVKFFKAGLDEMIGPKGVDLLFCNASEALSFTGTSDLIDAREALKKVARTFVVTLGENGAMIFDGETYIDIEPYPVKAIDSNGAGDMCAGAFLYGITHGHTYASSGKLASMAASKVVSQFGPRLRWHEAQEIKTKVFGG
ncbi:MAG TPA: adenosine kinase [Bacteriovoracaceae bacterium]|nr:adenosine kinase [Bacteriovoracaceae bacterium]